MRIVVGIGGGIAAYKATMLLRLFSKAGHEVIAMPTEAALQFIGKPTLEALSSNPVSTSVFERVEDVNHVRQADEADAVVIAPATADLMSRLAQGRADDLLTATVLTTHAPVILAPAMHTQMWEHPATQENVQRLRSFGYEIIPPAHGRLTGPDSGVGRMPEPEDIFSAALEVIEQRGELSSLTDPNSLALDGKRVVITAGGTREPLDPVRFLGNKSSGKQGIALAQVAQRMGAEVKLICAHVDIDIPEDISTVRVSTGLELKNQVENLSRDADILIMAAAVADFRPVAYEEFKIKKNADTNDAPTIELVRNPDILREIVVRRQQEKQQQPAVIVGFAAETGSAEKSYLSLGREKLVRKGCDFLAVNDVSNNAGFGTDSNALTILSKFNNQEIHCEGTKEEVSLELLLAVTQHLSEPLASSSQRVSE